MDLGISAEQRELIGSFSQLFTKRSSSEKVRDAEPGGFDEALWRTLLDTGAVIMGVPEAHGGWGASLLDLTLVAEQVGLFVAPAPVIEAQVAARLLSALGTPESLAALQPVLAGEQMVTLAVHRPVGSDARLVPAGAVCDSVIVLDGEHLRLVSVGDDNRKLVHNLASAPLADVDVSTHGVELASGPVVVNAFESALDEWLTLTAAAVVGMGSAALEIACEYARGRVAFGTLIGAFQAVSHPLANAATALDGARLLTHKAAWSIDGGKPRARELAAMAFAFASRTGATSTYDSLHVHGGYGFMREYDVQLYFCRARGWARVWGDAEAADRRAATARYGKKANR